MLSSSETGVLEQRIKSGDSLLIDSRANLALEKLPKAEVEELVLEEVPDVSYDDIGGLDGQIEEITDAVELPFLHASLFAEYDLPAPKGILLYGPPGCGKTLIAKAVANSLAKKVAEASPATRRVAASSSTSRVLSCSTSTSARPSVRSARSFQRAREKASEGWPVIVFFDEMESLFRTRGAVSAPTWSRPSCRSCWRRSTVSRACEERHRHRCLEP